jgi:hypothetical protein
VDSVGIVSLIVPLLAVALALGWLVLHYSASLVHVDIRRVYLYFISFVALVLAATALLLVIQDATRIVLGADPAAGFTKPGFPPGRQDPLWDLSFRESMAGGLGIFAAATPAWIWHFRRAARSSLVRQAWTMHRFYLYAVAVVFLVAGIGFLGAMAAQGLRVLLGLVDVGNQSAVRDLWQNVVRGLANGGICAVLWWTHYRAISVTESRGRAAGA